MEDELLMTGGRPPAGGKSAVVWTKDSRRHNNLHPGQVLYSARMDPDGLKCFHRFFYLQCCCTENIVSRTFVDVYSHGVHLSAPMRICCCFCDMNTVAYYDRPMFSTPTVQADCMKPFPWVFPHCFGRCGEVLAFPGGWFGCPDVIGGGHCFFVAICGCCFPINLMFGLAPGEAAATSMIINNEIMKYRSGPYEPAAFPAHFGGSPMSSRLNSTRNNNGAGGPVVVLQSNTRATTVDESANFYSNDEHRM